MGCFFKYAKNMQEAGADALELNVYYIPTNNNLTGSEIENMYVDTLTAVKESVFEFPLLESGVADIKVSAIVISAIA